MNNSTRKEKSGTSKAKELFGNMNSETLNGMVSNASKIVLKAANILEEEIARGIIAAKHVEEKFTDVSKLRASGGNATQHDELMNRFRKDAHEIIDIVIDFAAIAVNNAGKISSQFINIKQGTNTNTQAAPVQENIPLIKVPKKLKRGETFTQPINLENDSKTESKKIKFIHNGLTNSHGDKLSQKSIVFAPNPLLIKPGGEGAVTVTLSIPKTAKPGIYTCFVQAENMESLKATVWVEII